MNANFHFDDIVNAFLSVFVVIMLEGWPTVALIAVDSVEPGVSPKKDSRPAIFFFFMVIIIVGAFLIMQLFITIVFEKFIELRCQVMAKPPPDADIKVRDNKEHKPLTPAQLDLIEFEDRLVFDTQIDAPSAGGT